MNWLQLVLMLGSFAKPNAGNGSGCPGRRLHTERAKKDYLAIRELPAQ